MNSSRLRIAVPLAIALLATCSCASAPAKKDQFIAYLFTGGEYSKLLEETFGDDARKGINFFVLPNAWSRVQPNGLLVSPGRARYVWKEAGTITRVDRTPSSCPELGPLLTEFDAVLKETMDHARGVKPYSDPSKVEVLDGRSYVIEVHGQYANIVIDPRGNFPSISVALKIIEALMQCHEQE